MILAPLSLKCIEFSKKRLKKPTDLWRKYTTLPCNIHWYLPQNGNIFSLFLDFPGSLQSRLDTFELTQSLQRVLGSPFKFGGKFKFFQLFYKTLQYGCLWTPLDPSNQKLTFLSWLDLQRVLGLISNLTGNSKFSNFHTKLHNMSVYYGPPGSQ